MINPDLFRWEGLTYFNLFRPISLGRSDLLSQERQGVPARWGDPDRGIPTPKPPTIRESHDPLEPGPLPKEVQEGAAVLAGRGRPSSREGGGGRGPSSWCDSSSACTGSRRVGIPRAGSPQLGGPLAFSHSPVAPYFISL